MCWAQEELQSKIRIEPWIELRSKIRDEPWIWNVGYTQTSDTKVLRKGYHFQPSILDVTFIIFFS